MYTQQKLHWSAWSLLITGGALTLASPIIVTWKPEFRLFHLPLYEQLQSISFNVGETIHANVLAGVLLVPLLLAFSLLWRQSVDRKVAQQIGLVVLMCVMLFMFILTQSRAGYLGFSVGIGLWAILRWSRLLWGLPLLGIGLIWLFQRFGIFSVLNGLAAGNSFGGWTGRLDIWTQSSHALQDFVLTGIGIGTFTLVIPLLYPLQVNIEGFPHAHNLFLQIGLDLGLPGLIAYLSIIISCFSMLVPLVRERSDPLRWSLSIGQQQALLSECLFMAFWTPFYGVQKSHLFLGCSLRLSQCCIFSMLKNWVTGRNSGIHTFLAKEPYLFC